MSLNKGNNWTLAEIEVLRDNYGILKYRDIAAKLGRTIGAVQKKAELLGITQRMGNDNFFEPTITKNENENYFSEHNSSDNILEKIDFLEFNLNEYKVSVDFNTKEVKISKQ